MIRLEDLSEDFLQDFLVRDVEVHARYYGPTLTVVVSEDGRTYVKAKGKPLELSDLLVQDGYDSIVRVTEKLALPEGRHDFVWSHGRIVYQGRHGLPEGCDIVRNGSPIFVGTVNKDLKKKVVERKNLFNHFGCDPNVSSLIFSDGSEKFSVRRGVDSRTVPSAVYNLVMVDAVVKLEERHVRNVVLSEETPDRIYVELVDRLFSLYCSRSKFDLEQMHFDFPETMRVTLDKSRWLLPGGLESVTQRNYGAYIMMLLMFRGDPLRSNGYLVESTKKKYIALRSAVEEVCKDKWTNTNFPTSSDMEQ